MEKEIAQFKQLHDKFLQQVKSFYMNREVTLINTYPKVSRGRAAHIKAVTVQDGVPTFLCMVLRSGSETEYLNGPVWSRSYRPLDQFVVIDDA